MGSFSCPVGLFMHLWQEQGTHGYLWQVGVMYDALLILNAKRRPCDRYIFPVWVSCVKPFQTEVNLKIIDLWYFQHSFKTYTVSKAHLSTEGSYRRRRKHRFFFSLNGFRSTSSDNFALTSVLLWGFSTQITVQRRNQGDAMDCSISHLCTRSPHVMVSPYTVLCPRNNTRSDPEIWACVCAQ